jgi:uncharacterized membrane protein YfcA
MDFKISLLGLLIGLLVGLTGTGGGALLTPLLILLGWTTPLIAVGTDLVWSTLTKATGAVIHWRQGTVDLTLVKRLALGSVPGALVGLALLAKLRSIAEYDLDRMVLRLLGVTLVGVAVSLLWRCFRGSQQAAAIAHSESPRQARITILAGFVVGFLVSITSVGSGSLIIVCLLMLYPGTPVRRIVGSDIVHALLLGGVAATGHLGMKSINLPVLSALLVGSLPGVLIGSKLTTVVPERALRPLLGTTLLLLGYKLL